MPTRLAERLSLIAVLYGVSGALGLVYEVAFNKYLAFVFGATAYASSAVLVAFMGGLALGAHLASKVERRISRPLFAYGLAEIAIGVFCWNAPALLGRIGAFYVDQLTKHAASAGAAAATSGSLVSISFLRAALAVVVVLVPAAGMGATLPLLARFVQREDPALARRRLARLYAINTFGGAMGSLLGAYVILPGLGLAWTMQSAGVVSATIGVVAVVLGFRHRVSADVASAEAEKAESKAAASNVVVHGDVAAGSLPFRDAMVLAAASGLLVFGCEVVMVHVLALVIGTSVYAFGLMLFIFLVCLSLGAPIATWLAGRYGRSATAIGFAASGIALVLSLVVWDKLPALFIALGPSVRSWPARELTRALAATFALSVPVALMGTTFPLVLRTARAATVGADVGRLTVANTLGSMAGSILLGFAVLPLLGSQRSLVFIGVVYLATAAYVARHAHEDRAKVLRLVAVGVLAAFAVPPWNLARLTSGANVYFNDGTVPNSVVESVSEDVHGGVTTIVRDDQGVRTLCTNGKFEGNDGHEIADNRGFVHLPVAFARRRDNGLVIGLGTGTSAGTMAAYDFASIDVVELSPAIVRAARTTFGPLNHHVLDDPRVRLLVDDGRNVLLLSKKQYDVVSIEVSSIWFAGAANLYNKEFYKLVYDRLSEGGVLQQWFQLHHTNRRIVATELATLRAVFPFVSIAVTGHQGQLIASKTPLTVSRDKLVDLEKVGYVKETLEGAHLADYVKRIVVDYENVNAFLDDTTEKTGLSFNELVSTDDNLFLEYATPKMNVPTADDIPDTIAYLSAYKTRKSLTLYLTP